MTIVVVGDVINDLIVRPASGAASAFDSDTESEITAVPGGSGGNQAAWLAALGVAVRLAARVGASDAAAHRHLLLDAGVDPSLSIDPEVPTGSIVVLVGAAGRGTRAMFTDRGANARLATPDLPPELLAGARHLHVCGHALIEPASRAAVSSLWQAAAAKGLTRSVDVGSAAFMGNIGPGVLEWTAGADLVFANMEEAAVVTGIPGDRAAVVTRLVARFPIVVLKLGAEGAVIATVSATVVCPPAEADVVDPTGAGDAFCAGLLASWLGGAGLPAAGTAATEAAATALAVVGGRPAAIPAGRDAPEPPWDRLRREAHAVAWSAYAPYSGLRVGAAGLTGDGRIVTGCNVENASFGLTLCAECGLVSALRAAGADRLVAMSVVAHDGQPLAPCGRCRQVLFDNGGPTLLIDRGPAAGPVTLGELLPAAFDNLELDRRRQR